MTRKDYKMIAEIIRHYMEPAADQGDDRVAGTLEALVADLCIELKRDNSGFDRDRFEVACGL